jgi:hypothetical protein
MEVEQNIPNHTNNPNGRTPTLYKLAERKTNLGLSSTSFDITKMLPRHYQILDLFLQGKTFGEIATIVEMNPQRISQIYNSPSFQDQLARRRRSIEKETDSAIAAGVISNVTDVTKRLKNLSNRAVDKLENLMESDDENVQFRSAADVLDRSGFAKVSRIESESKASVIVLDAELINLLKNVLSEDRDSNSPNETEFIVQSGEQIPDKPAAVSNDSFVSPS